MGKIECTNNLWKLHPNYATNIALKWLQEVAIDIGQVVT